MAERTGHVAQEIAAFAEAGKFDLLVLGSKGRGAIADLLIGSVAQRVLAAVELALVGLLWFEGVKWARGRQERESA